MDARVPRFFLLVAFIYGVLLASAGTGVSGDTGSDNDIESYVKSLDFEHYTAGTNNTIKLIFTNPYETTTDFEVDIAVLCVDEQTTEGICVDLEFSLEWNEDYIYEAPINVQSSGRLIVMLDIYAIDLTGNSIQGEYVSERLFYDYKDFKLEEYRGIDLDERDDNAWWEYTSSGNDERIKLVNHEETSSMLSIVFGPAVDRSDWGSQIYIEYMCTFADEQIALLEYSTDYRPPPNLYGGEWSLIAEIAPSMEYSLNYFEIPELLIDDEPISVYFRITVAINDADENTEFELSRMGHTYYQERHSLGFSYETIYNAEHKDIVELDIMVENKGIYTQNLNNITFIVEVTRNGILEQYHESSVYLQEEEETLVTFNIDISEPGVYTCNFKAWIIDESVFYYEDNILIAYSNQHEADEEENVIILTEQGEYIIDIDFNSAELIIETDDFEKLEFEPDYTNVQNVDEYYIVAIEDISENIKILSNGDVVFQIFSLISTEQRNFDVWRVDKEGSHIEEAEIIFINTEMHYLDLKLSNLGYFDEYFEIRIEYDDEFVKSVEGASYVKVLEEQTGAVRFVIIPNTEPLNYISTMSINVIQESTGDSIHIPIKLTYSDSKFDVEEWKWNRFSMIQGQKITGSCNLVNNGYPASEITVRLYIQDNNGNIITLDEVYVSSLGYGEIVTIGGEYTLEYPSEYTPMIEVEKARS